MAGTLADWTNSKKLCVVTKRQSNSIAFIDLILIVVVIYAFWGLIQLCLLVVFYGINTIYVVSWLVRAG